MTTCAWHEPITPSPVKKTFYFDPATSHGICVYCAMRTLAHRPHVLVRFLLRQGYSRDVVAFLLRRQRHSF